MLSDLPTQSVSQAKINNVYFRIKGNDGQFLLPRASQLSELAVEALRHVKLRSHHVAEFPGGAEDTGIYRVYEPMLV